MGDWGKLPIITHRIYDEVTLEHLYKLSLRYIILCILLFKYQYSTITPFRPRPTQRIVENCCPGAAIMIQLHANMHYMSAYQQGLQRFIF
jgi:hypothetical protein